MQQENKLRYCARATNVRFFTRNTLSRFLTLKHMLATEAQRELEECTLCSIDQTTAMLCSSGSKALTLVCGIRQEPCSVAVALKTIGNASSLR